MKFRLCALLLTSILLVPVRPGVAQQERSSLDARLFYDVYEVDNGLLRGTFRAADLSAYPVFVAAAPVEAIIARRGARSYEAAYRLMLAEGMAFVGASVLKRLYARDRPYLEREDVTSRANAFDAWILRHDPLSFPSGHATLAFAVAASLSLSYPQWEVAVPALTWASLVATSRVYLGLHYPTDVLAGAALGTGAAVGVHLLAEHITPDVLRSDVQVAAAPQFLMVRVVW